MIHVYYNNSRIFETENPDDIIMKFAGKEKSFLNALEIHLRYPSSLIRVIDYDTVLRCRNVIISYVETSYYSGQDDGSFTIFDSKYLEENFPKFYSIRELSNDDVLSELSSKLSGDMNARLVSANHAVLMGLYAIIDGVFFLKERPSYLYIKNPQRDSLEFLISHIALYDIQNGDIKPIADLDNLLAEVLSDNLRAWLDVSEFLGEGEI